MLFRSGLSMFNNPFSRNRKEELGDKKFLYRFCTVSPYEYECRLSLRVSGGVISDIFYKSLDKMKFNKKVDLAAIRRFEVEERFLKLLKNGLNKPVKEVNRHVVKDGYKVLDYEVEKAIFSKDPDADKWTVEIHIKGKYTNVKVE